MFFIIKGILRYKLDLTDDQLNENLNEDFCSEEFEDY